MQNNIHNVALYFKDFFKDKDYFNLINKEHKFQELTESNKESNAFRKGIYLTKVEHNNDSPDEFKFNLLRCSSNLAGPTDNFRETDKEIINSVNEITKYYYEDVAELNHVLAQIYYNKKTENGERKAKIKAHSDKTKDMSENGLLAFCTFYEGLNSTSEYDENCLTKMRFNLKNPMKYPNLEKRFEVILHPNSLLIISLDTNRLYTHEISPSILPIDKISTTRLGYVIRSSKRSALFKNGQTYIKNDNNEYIKLEEPDKDGIEKLKELYYVENTSDEIVKYPPFYFSLNQGDYMQPIL